MNDAADHLLWDRAREGDAAAFGTLFERHGARIYNYCFRRTADWALAEDLTSTTFLVAWRARGREPLRVESALPLLFGIATNVLRNQRRSLKRGREAFSRVPLAQVKEPDFAEEAAIRLDDQAAVRQLLQLFSRLPRREQDVLALCEWSNLSYEDTAAALGIPIGTVRSRLARGRRRLRELAMASGPEDDTSNANALSIEVNDR
ncbi:MAG TPA: RNA polymerase sigma factor [Gaiellaceae bacterium]|jgi:RNA polymerase sigma-70 factor (ECF subfamily)